MRTFLVLIPMMLLAMESAHAGMGGKLSFSKDYEKSMAKADKEGRPVAIYFTADW